MNNPEPVIGTATNPTTEIRRRISRDLFRSILWVDEQIFSFETNRHGNKEYDYVPFETLFKPVTQELQDAGFLVHLHSFEQSTTEDGFDDEFSADSPSLNSAISLSQKADIIILDWHLGNGDDPKNSIKILEALIDSPATRILLILSQYSDRFSEELSKSKLSQLKKEERGDTWTTKNGLHLKVLRKKPDGINRITGDKSLNRFFPCFHSTILITFIGQHWKLLRKFAAMFPNGFNLCRLEPTFPFSKSFCIKKAKFVLICLRTY